MKYIFVTGGVVSSLGKGLAAAALGTLLERRGLRVLMQKFDPYLNVDPGTMSPFQHGEVYVLDDGAETDLDLGHYERFTSGRLSKLNNITSGQVYETVIKNERQGLYLGATVQVIPHVTDVIKNRIYEVAEKSDVDVIITEIGGTTGDIEGLPFLEALRQFKDEVGHENVAFMHATLIPYIKAAEELKTKPTQQSVAKLREIGITPDVILCRSEYPLDNEIRRKISMFCNIRPEAVIPFLDIQGTIYRAPLNLHDHQLDSIICERLGLETPDPDLIEWRNMVDRIVNPSHSIKIGVVGKYIDHQDAYKSIYESLTHAGAANDTKVEIVRIDSSDIEEDGAEKYLGEVSGVLIPGGFGDRGIEGKISAARYARENDIPYFGICLGMQIAVIEFARNACGLEHAHSTEFAEGTPHPVICLLEDQKGINDKGGTMRLGTWETKMTAGSRSAELYGQQSVNERHRHRYELNQNYLPLFGEKGLQLVGTSPDGTLGEVIEIPGHPFFIAVQFHPEFQSKPNAPHPLFKGFIAAALENRR
ncbi:MAG: CTP synthase [Verrucomicrobiaceae bacterium]|nr:CTP synthase [Verrucomicrobiaceae bacterium]